MKPYRVVLRFHGLTGEYMTDVEVMARHAASAKKKAERTIGNRDGHVVSVTEFNWPTPVVADWGSR